MKKTFKQKLYTFFGYTILIVLAVTYALAWSLTFGIRVACLVHGIAVAAIFAVWFAFYLLEKGEKNEKKDDLHIIDFNNWNYDLKHTGESK